MSQVRLRQINLAFNDVNILNGIDITIKAGEFCVFIGPSGCGKSTLLRLIAGLEHADSGTIEIDGINVTDVDPAKRNIAMVFQSYALYPHMNVFENMAFALRRARMPENEIIKRVNEASRILQLDDLLQRMPRALSGGQRQRVAIGRAIVKKPKVFLFDEPLSNLDASLRVQTRLEIAKLHRDLGSASMIYVTHDQVEAMTLASKIVLLKPTLGKPDSPSVAQIGTPLALYHHPENIFAAGFIGTPRMNFLSAKVNALLSDRIEVEFEEIRCAAHVSPDTLTAGQPLTLGIRPEHVVLMQGPWTGVVTHIEALGEHSYVYLNYADGQPILLAKTQSETVRVGDVVPFSLPAESIHAFRADGMAQRRTAYPTPHH
jgi:multiple sugar transport system ATP-binding protein